MGLQEGKIPKSPRVTSAFMIQSLTLCSHVWPVGHRLGMLTNRESRVITLPVVSMDGTICSFVSTIFAFPGSIQGQMAQCTDSEVGGVKISTATIQWLNKDQWQFRTKINK